LQKAPGRTVFGATSADISGIAYCDFDTANDKIAVVAGGSYYTAPAGESGSFTELTDGAGSSLEVVTVQDKAVLLSGGRTNRVLLNDGTSREHGLQPVTSPPGLLHTATTGTWPLGANSVPKFYEYWTTEVYKTGADEAAEGYDEVESTFSGTTATIEVTAVTSFVTVTRPQTVNPSATHWRVYRSNGKTAFFEAAFPIGFLIADVPINTVEFNDGKTTTTAFTAPTAATALLTYPSSLVTPDNTEISVSQWVDPGDITTDDANTTTSPSVSTTWAGHEGGTMVVAGIVASNFGFTNIGSPITNIEVQVEGSRTGSAILSAYLSSDNGNTWTTPVTIPLSTGNATVTVSGGQWGRTWNGGELVDGAFKLLLLATGPTNSGSGTITIDVAKVAVTHSGSSAQQVIQFPNVELLIGGELFPVGANGAPPRSNTGDLFQGAILMNDLDAPTNVVWTIPDTIDYVPVPYRLALDDRVVGIRALGTSALIGCGGTVTRMNYLPVAEDPEFNTGRAQDLLDSDDGWVSNKAAVRFVLGGRLRLFYVGQTSLKTTDAFETDTATDDLVWTSLVDPTNIGKCFVENNARNREILVYYPAFGSSTVNKTLRLSYDTMHLKNGKLKVVSITEYGATAAAAGVLPSGERMLFTAKGSSVYVENRGYTDISGGSNAPLVSTREIYQGGHGGSWELTKIGVHHQGGGGELRTQTTASLANNPPVTTDPQTTLMVERRTDIIDTVAGGDGITITLSGDDDGLPWEIDYLILYPAPQGDSAPLTQ
jgi:hypothetical protein